MEGNSHKISVLYVGKNPDVIESLKNKVGELDVVQYGNGLKAIDYLRKSKGIDVIIAETHLAGIQGYELGVHIKERLGFWKIPYVLIAFEKDPSFREKIFRKKTVFDDLYVYPVDIDQLIVRIRFLIHYLNGLMESKNMGLSRQRIYKIPLIKRLFDIMVSSTALIILSPLFLLVAVAIKLESKGPVIYRSKRVGTGYRIFDFFKFRSMYTGAEFNLKALSHLNQYNKNIEGEKQKITIEKPCPRCAKLPEGQHCSSVLYIGGNEICEYWYHTLKDRGKGTTFIKIKNDPRVTKIGKFIRNTSIDELPQLFNVLKGAMSIVGNRPLPLYEAELLTSDDWGARFLAPAGITGLWQVKLRGKGGVMSEEERKALDNKYAETYSFWGDIKLILSTIPALFQKENV